MAQGRLAQHAGSTASEGDCRGFFGTLVIFDGRRTRESSVWHRICQRRLESGIQNSQKEKRMTPATAPQQFDAITSKTPRCQNPQAIQAAIQDGLDLTGYSELRLVQVEFDDGAVTITGQVPTYYLKQLAQNVALNLPGIEQIHNELHVC
jgi:osmotically-inducible protein OsmY